MENGQQGAKGGGWETSKEIIAVVQATEESWLDQGFGVALKPRGLLRGWMGDEGERRVGVRREAWLD